MPTPTTGSRRQDAAARNWGTFSASFPAEAAWLAANQQTNGFAYSLRAGVERYGSLTERQLAAVRGNLQRAATAAPAAQIRVPCDRIFAALNAAREAGLRRISLQVGRISLSLAPAGSRNPGSVYVKLEELYLGRLKDGIFHPAREWHNLNDEAKAGVMTDLQGINQDPLAAARLHGQRTGRCACCGRTLTDPDSIAAGIGPICAGRFGWGTLVENRMQTANREYVNSLRNYWTGLNGVQTITGRAIDANAPDDGMEPEDL